jgi:hypothetical protein
MTAAFPRITFLALGTLLNALDCQAEPLHVRGLTPKARALITVGLTTSPSFHALVDCLNGSDVIVYVKEDPFLPRTLAAQLTFLSAAGNVRYLMVRLTARHAGRQQVAALGHELQHAVEVAERPHIASEQSLAHEFARMSSGGYDRPAPQRRYETIAARRAGDQVWRDLHDHAQLSVRVTLPQQRTDADENTIKRHKAR